MRTSPVVLAGSFGRRAGQSLVREAIGRLTPWEPLERCEDGYSIILGVPWILRHILDVNLRAIARCDLGRLTDIHIVFDRGEKPGMADFASMVAAEWPGLPLRFSWYAQPVGRLCEAVNVSTFYNGLNILTALSQCRTRAAVLHDFDLYPLHEDYFDALAGMVLDRGMRFAGIERTRYDGLRDEDDIYGTWGLAMDAAWLRNERRPVDILHRQSRLPDGRLIRLDPFSWLQLSEPRRAAVDGLTPDDVCHVKNLCSTYLRLNGGKKVGVAWRLHYLAYLEDVSLGSTDRMEELTASMDSAHDRSLTINGQVIDFSNVHWTCANVLRRELFKLDEFLCGEVRGVVRDFVASSARFFGGAETVRAEHQTILVPA
ncbi:MAG: hypothetical protein LAT64_13330 [Phycisphaerales bacterium]|nr:hypothetical protein [Planctomycetota bacterium]MCH8509737.1 hypothetical protein [Phycisphaerales bacterium]